jgi:hypothetical protein
VKAALADQATMMHTVIVAALAGPKNLQALLKELDEDGD